MSERTALSAQNTRPTYLASFRFSPRAPSLVKPGEAPRLGTGIWREQTAYTAWVIAPRYAVVGERRLKAWRPPPSLLLWTMNCAPAGAGAPISSTLNQSLGCCRTRCGLFASWRARTRPFRKTSECMGNDGTGGKARRVHTSARSVGPIHSTAAHLHMALQGSVHLRAHHPALHIKEPCWLNPAARPFFRVQNSASTAALMKIRALAHLVPCRRHRHCCRRSLHPPLSARWCLQESHFWSCLLGNVFAKNNFHDFAHST